MEYEIRNEYSLLFKNIKISNNDNDKKVGK